MNVFSVASIVMPVACNGTHLEAIILTAKTTWRTMIAREIDRHERCIPLAVRVPEQKKTTL